MSVEGLRLAETTLGYMLVGLFLVFLDYCEQSRSLDIRRFSVVLLRPGTPEERRMRRRAATIAAVLLALYSAALLARLGIL